MTLRPVACTPGVLPPTANVAMKRPTKTIPVNGANRVHRSNIERSFRENLSAGAYGRRTPLSSEQPAQKRRTAELTAALAAWGKVASDFRCGTFFNNDLVAFVRGDHPLDFGVCVAGIHGEVCVLRPKCLVFGSRHLDALDTGCVPALADEVESLRSAPPKELCQTLDPFVDLAEDRLVQTEAFLTEVHGEMLARFDASSRSDHCADRRAVQRSRLRDRTS